MQLSRLSCPASQGGDTGSNPVGAANVPPVQRRRSSANRRVARRTGHPSPSGVLLGSGPTVAIRWPHDVDLDAAVLRIERGERRVLGLGEPQEPRSRGVPTRSRGTSAGFARRPASPVCAFTISGTTSRRGCWPRALTSARSRGGSVTATRARRSTSTHHFVPGADRDRRRARGGPPRSRIEALIARKRVHEGVHQGGGAR